MSLLVEVYNDKSSKDDGLTGKRINEGGGVLSVIDSLMIKGMILDWKHEFWLFHFVSYYF